MRLWHGRVDAGLEDGSLQEQERRGEIDDQAGDVDEGGDQGRGDGGGVQADPAEQEGEHGAHERAPEDDADEGDADGETDLVVEAGDVVDRVRALLDELAIGIVVGEVDPLPDVDAEQADEPEEDAQDEAAGGLATQDPEPVLEADLAQGHGADDEGG